MRLLVLTRLSQDRAGQTGLESQTDEVLRWAEAERHIVVHVAADKKSGTTAPWDRPNAKAWLSDPKKIALYDAVVAFKFDRLSRGDKRSTNAIEAWAHANGKKLLTVDGLVFPSEGADGIRWDVTARLAHQEWLNTSERYRRMQNHLRNAERSDGGKGFLVGRRPFGYRIVKMDGHKFLEPDPYEAAYVREMAVKYLSGVPVAHICDWLESEGVKPPASGRWRPAGVKSIITNPSMTGKRLNAAGKVILEFEPILDEDTYRQVAAKWEANREHPRPGRRPSRSSLLTDVAYCDQCGEVMKMRWYEKKLASGSTGVYHQYRCTGDIRARSECKNSFRVADLDGMFEASFLGLLGPLELTELGVVPGNGRDADIEYIENQLREIDYKNPDDRARIPGLTAELDRLVNLTPEPDVISERPTGETVARKWAALGTTEARNRWLQEGQVRCYVSKQLGVFRMELSAVLGMGGEPGWRVSGASLAEIARRSATGDGFWFEPETRFYGQES